MSGTSKQIFEHYRNLSQNGKVMATYVWVDGTKENVRCKTMTLEGIPKSVDELRVWNFDGSSTGQATGEDSDVLIKPVAIFKDPFRGGDNILVMTECLNPDGTPHSTNSRRQAFEIFEKVKAQEPWFGIEQEYSLLQPNGIPLGWPDRGFPPPQGPYYCGVGTNKIFGRDIIEAHYKACLYAGVKICGTNAEVMPSQWEFQVGPCKGIDIGDHMWMARYILHHVAEDFGVVVTFDPKPIPGDWNGAGCHTNYSTKAMRAAGGMTFILEACEKLGTKHHEHIAVYGEGNERRLTGRHETASMDKFSYGVAHRGASIRIPRHVNEQGYGYLEDRRPASNSDPYIVSSKIAETTLL
mgnify:CR=1 FL=1